jgi:exocyst complex component 2
MIQETRLLITLGKFHTLKEKTLPTMLSSVSKTLDADMAHDRDTLVEVVDGMDQIVFDEFVKRRSHNLVKVMEEGILHSGIDWLNTSKPTGKFLGSTAKHGVWGQTLINEL